MSQEGQYQPHEWYRGEECREVTLVRVITPHGGRPRVIVYGGRRPESRGYVCLDTVFSWKHDLGYLMDWIIWANTFAYNTSFEINPHERIIQYLMDPDLFDQFEDGWSP